MSLAQKIPSGGVFDAAIAISPASAPAMANRVRAIAPEVPVMIIDADFIAEDRDLRATYLGTDNYLMGVKMAEEAAKLKTKGCTVCLQLGNVAADNINARAQGFRDTAAGEKGVDRLTGQNGWSEIEGCPVFTDDQADLANQQISDFFTAHPDLDDFILVGGWAQFAPQAYARVTNQVRDKLKSKELVIIACDAQDGRQPFELGLPAPGVMLQRINGQTVDWTIHSSRASTSPTKTIPARAPTIDRRDLAVPDRIGRHLSIMAVGRQHSISAHLTAFGKQDDILVLLRRSP